MPPHDPDRGPVDGDVVAGRARRARDVLQRLAGAARHDERGAGGHPLELELGAHPRHRTGERGDVERPRGHAVTVAAVFLILHGYMGSGPDHWQRWLAGRLRAQGERVACPDLPDPEHPRRAAWRAAFADADRGRRHRDRALARVRGLARPLRRPGHRRPARARAARRPAVARGRARRARRVLPGAARPRAGRRGGGQHAARLRARRSLLPRGRGAALRRAARARRRPPARRRARQPGRGYGPWPGVEAWCYGASASTSSRIAPG